MHVLQRPHLPRAIGVSVAAALLAIVITLLLAGARDDVSQSGAGSTLARHRAPAVTSVQQTVAAERWASDPFAPLLSRPLPRSWRVARR
jgi:hypothetical protein